PWMVEPRRPSSPSSFMIGRSKRSCRLASSTRGMSFSCAYWRAVSRTSRSSSESWSSRRRASSQTNSGRCDFVSAGFAAAAPWAGGIADLLRGCVGLILSTTVGGDPTRKEREGEPQRHRDTEKAPRNLFCLRRVASSPEGTKVSFDVVPAKAGTHRHKPLEYGPRLSPGRRTQRRFSSHPAEVAEALRYFRASAPPWFSFRCRSR